MEQVEKDLLTWFEYVSNKFQWLNIKYEFSENRYVWLVSFSPSSQIDSSDEFNKEAMDFENNMNLKYGSEAPLFTDEEYLFKLSHLAQTFGLQSFDSSQSVILSEKRTMAAWSPSLFVISSFKSEPSQFFTDFEDSFATVA